MRNPDAVQVTTVVEVGPTEAFRIFTEEVDSWWGHGPQFRTAGKISEMRFEPRVGGRLLVIEGSAEPFVLGQIKVWDPPKRLVFDMGGRAFAEGEWTEVEICFEAEGEATRITVDHRGFEKFPADHGLRHGLDTDAFLDMMALWWADLLAMHRRGATGRGPTPQLGYFTLNVRDTAKGRAFFGPLFGWSFDEGEEADRYSHVDGPEPPMGLNRSDAPGATLYFRVQDIHRSVEKVRELGGKAEDPQHFPSGWSCNCEDDQGTPFSLWQPSPEYA